MHSLATKFTHVFLIIFPLANAMAVCLTKLNLIHFHIKHIMIMIYIKDAIIKCNILHRRNIKCKLLTAPVFLIVFNTTQIINMKCL